MSSSRVSSGSRTEESAVNPTRSVNRTDTSRRSATSAGVPVDAELERAAGGAGTTPATRGVPHSPQNRIVGALAVPHDGHAKLSWAPHPPQNLRPGSFSVPQLVQVMAASPSPLSRTLAQCGLSREWEQARQRGQGSWRPRESEPRRGKAAMAGAAAADHTTRRTGQGRSSYSGAPRRRPPARLPAAERDLRHSLVPC